MTSIFHVCSWCVPFSLDFWSMMSTASTSLGGNYTCTYKAFRKPTSSLLFYRSIAHASSSIWMAVCRCACWTVCIILLCVVRTPFKLMHQYAARGYMLRMLWMLQYAVCTGKAALLPLSSISRKIMCNIFNVNRTMAQRSYDFITHMWHKGTWVFSYVCCSSSEIHICLPTNNGMHWL